MTQQGGGHLFLKLMLNIKKFEQDDEFVKQYLNLQK
jgi:hypothetical protein